MALENESTCNHVLNSKYETAKTLAKQGNQTTF